jgi:hypothetical protein
MLRDVGFKCDPSARDNRDQVWRRGSAVSLHLFLCVAHYRASRVRSILAEPDWEKEDL